MRLVPFWLRVILPVVSMWVTDTHCHPMTWRVFHGFGQVRDRSNTARQMWPPRISVALVQHGVTPLANYPDLNAATAHATMTIPLLDVYRDLRSGGWLGAGPFTLPTSLPQARAGLFATVYEDMQFDKRIVEGIAESEVGGMVMIPNLLRRNRKLLAATAGFETPNELQAIGQHT